jgi:hypothetical protein
MIFVKKKTVGDTLNYYFTPQVTVKLWNGYIFDVVNNKSIVLSFEKDKNFLLYKLLQRKGEELKDLCKLDIENVNVYSESRSDTQRSDTQRSDTQRSDTTETETETKPHPTYFYVRIFVPKNKMMFFRTAKGLTLKEAEITISNIWCQNNRYGFNNVLNSFQFEN